MPLSHFSIRAAFNTCPSMLTRCASPCFIDRTCIASLTPPSVLSCCHSMKTMRLNDFGSPSPDGTWKSKKFAFDRTANLAHIPVVKATIRKPFGF